MLSSTVLLSSCDSELVERGTTQQHYLSTIITSVPSVRLFSKAESTMDHQRNRLTNIKFNIYLFLQYMNEYLCDFLFYFQD
jgi:hypothetical protein